MERYQDPNDPFNGEEYQTGKECIEPSCHNPAGTYWSHLWCFECNVKRIDRIGASLKQIVEENDTRRI